VVFGDISGIQETQDHTAVRENTATTFKTTQFLHESPALCYLMSKINMNEPMLELFIQGIMPNAHPKPKH
jgi:hypothetical protein